MIRMIQSRSAARAKAYFTEALVKADYYLDGQEMSGLFQGKLAERLGLAGPVTKDAFFSLCENINPETGKPLTPRTKEERTTGYDLNFHCPKSVSVLNSLSGDDHILRAFEDSVRQTMLDIEADARTRVRKGGAMEERATGELLWADFIHQTARPVEGHLPDPHLHAHCFVFNATWDEEEKQIKAAQFRDINASMPWYQARFHKRLSDRLMEAGYQIRRTDKSFEVEGVPQPVIDLFSKRTDEIGRVAKEKGITGEKELAELGARTRANKQKGHTMDELRAEWRRQIRDLGEEGKGAQAVRFAPAKATREVTPRQCVDHAVQHGFERASVVEDRRLLAAAYRHALGHRDVTLQDTDASFAEDERIIHVQEWGRTRCTTRQVLAEEKRMVSLAREGMGKLQPLYPEAPNVKLDGQQGEAVRHVLTTPHRVCIVRGVAGSGKTTLMREAIEHIEQAGKRVTVVAPTSEASRGVLRQEGMKEADTVAKLLADAKMQQALNGQVLWVDEAGLLGTGDMTRLLELATEKNARLILGGDTRQHASVVRGDALRILNTVGGIRAAEVSKIYRQRSEDYRRAVEHLAQGNVQSAFDKLDAMGSIQSVDPLKPNEKLVRDYADALRRGKSALVISPTHQQGEQVTQAIREHLKQKGLLGKKEHAVTRLASLNRTEAEKGDWRNFSEGHVVQLSQNLPGMKRGSVWTVERSSEKGVFVRGDDGHTVALPLAKSAQFELYRKSEMPLARGDAVRITRNGFDREKNRLHNGQVLHVQAVGKNGDLVLRNQVSKARYTLDREFGHLSHAYCVTSHAAQGKTVDEVFIAQPAATFSATDAKQVYVSVSRGRDRARIYTDDKEELLAHAARLGDRQSALELVGSKNRTRERVEQRVREAMNRHPASDKPAPKPTRTKARERDHEPGL
jgi:conjugative relaxase-like TrwC/TraI family protein